MTHDIMEIQAECMATTISHLETTSVVKWWFTLLLFSITYQSGVYGNLAGEGWWGWTLEMEEETIVDASHIKSLGWGMAVIFNNAATRHACECGGRLSAQWYERRAKKKKDFFPPLCSCYREGLPIFLRGATQCSAIMLRKLLFCNFTPGDKQIKIYYLGWWSAAGQEIGSFSPNKRIISATYLSESILWWQGDMDDCSDWFELGQRIMEMKDRQLIWLCATVNVWGGERIIV